MNKEPRFNAHGYKPLTIHNREELSRVISSTGTAASSNSTTPGPTTSTDHSVSSVSTSRFAEENSERTLSFDEFCARREEESQEGFRPPKKQKKKNPSDKCTCHRLPRGGGPRADVGEYGDFFGTLQQISALVVGEMWGLRFLNALLSGRMWGLRFCTTERRLETIDCSLDRWQDGGGEDDGMFQNPLFFFSIKQTIRQKLVHICRHKQL